MGLSSILRQANPCAWGKPALLRRLTRCPAHALVVLPTFWKRMSEDTNDSRSASGGSKFPLGQVVATRTALATLPTQGVAEALDRHRRGDWGDVGKEDWQANERALKQGERLLSVYRTADGTRFWIITEWDRSLTTVLLPGDY